MKQLSRQFGDVLRLFAVLIVATCAHDLALAQQNDLPSARPKPKLEKDQKPTAEATAVPYVSGYPINCESFATLVDNAVVEWHEQPVTYLIIITRLGQRESIHLRKSRLKDIEAYLKRFDSIKIVTAEGSRIQSLGQVEFYVAGKLRTVIPIAKNSPTICSGKVNPFM